MQPFLVWKPQGWPSTMTSASSTRKASSLYATTDDVNVTIDNLYATIDDVDATIDDLCAAIDDRYATIDDVDATFMPRPLSHWKAAASRRNVHGHLVDVMAERLAHFSGKAGRVGKA